MKKILIASIFAFSFMFVGAPTPAIAADCGTAAQCMQSGADIAGNGSSNKVSANVLIKRIVNVLLFVLGAVSVIMIIFGGIKYTTSNGDQNKVVSAKNTIVYSVVGVIVALLAYAIVNFVISSFSS